MADPFAHVSAGDLAPRPSAERYNVVSDMAREYLVGRGEAPAAPYKPNGVHIFNDSGAARSILSVCGIGDPAADLDAGGNFQFNIVFDSAPPTRGEPFAILQEPAPDGYVAAAKLSGETWVKVSVSDSSHGYADAATGDYSKLASQAAPGPAKIIWKESGTGVKWAYVLLDQTNAPVEDCVCCQVILEATVDQDGTLHINYSNNVASIVRLATSPVLKYRVNFDVEYATGDHGPKYAAFYDVGASDAYFMSAINEVARTTTSIDLVIGSSSGNTPSGPYPSTWSPLNLKVCGELATGSSGSGSGSGGTCECAFTMFEGNNADPIPDPQTEWPDNGTGSICSDFSRVSSNLLDWTALVSGLHRIQVWGPGGGSICSPLTTGDGGGGGAYAESTLSLAAGQTLRLYMPSGTQNVAAAQSSDSTLDAWVSTTAVAPTSSSEGALAKGGHSARGSGPGVGGAAATSIGTIKYSGGNGGSRNGSYSGGGGGGAGSGGNGSTGGNASSGHGTGGAGGPADAGGKWPGGAGHAGTFTPTGNFGSAPGGAAGGYPLSTGLAGGTSWVRISWCDGEEGGGGGNHPVVSVNNISYTASGDVSVVYKISDSDSSTCSISVEYSTNGGTSWNAATMGAGGDGTTGLTSSPSPGTPHYYSWDSLADGVALIAANSNVKVRITPSDTAAGTPGTNAAFTVDNRVQVFNASGTWVCPAGVATVEADSTGAGGDGEHVPGVGGTGIGGGGGGFARKSSIPVTPGASYAVTINASGAKFVGDGGATSWASNGDNGEDGGAGGTGLTGDVLHDGGDGGNFAGLGGGGGAGTADGDGQDAADNVGGLDGSGSSGSGTGEGGTSGGAHQDGNSPGGGGAATNDLGGGQGGTGRVTVRVQSLLP